MVCGTCERKLSKVRVSPSPTPWRSDASSLECYAPIVRRVMSWWLRVEALHGTQVGSQA